MKVLNDKYFKMIMNNYKNNKVPYKLEQTSVMKKLIVSNGKKYSLRPKNKLNGYELNLIKQVKDYANKLDLSKYPELTNKDVPYIQKPINIPLNVRYTADLYELDLSSAYWNYALNEGIISKKIHEYANNPKVSKASRLISLGNLAKKPLITEFNGSSFTMYQAEDLDTAKLFYLCAYYTSLQMIELERIAKNTAKGRFLFYWVDAIFFQGKNTLVNIQAELDSKGISYKIYKLDKVVRKKNEILVYSEDHKKKKRLFTFEKNKIKYVN